MQHHASIAGGSARAEYQRRLARHKERQRRRRPWVLSFAVVLVVVGLLHVGGTNAIVGWLCLAAALGALSDVVTTPQTITAWRTGADGEARTARFLEALEPLGFRVIHDRAIPRSPANIDHIVIGPPGVFVIDSKSFAGSVTIRGDDVFVAGRRNTAMIDQVKRAALAVDTALHGDVARDVRVAPIICVHRAELPWFRSRVDGVAIVSGRRMVRRLRKLKPVLSPAEVERLAALVDARLRPALPETAW